jgi:hypothetical protein
MAALIVALGITTTVLGWRGAARTLLVGEQIPWIVSGALTGVCLVACGAVVAAATHARGVATAERILIDRATAVADALLADLSRDR